MGPGRDFKRRAVGSGDGCVSPRHPRHGEGWCAEAERSCPSREGTAIQVCVVPDHIEASVSVDARPRDPFLLALHVVDSAAPARKHTVHLLQHTAYVSASDGIAGGEADSLGSYRCRSQPDSIAVS
eukprot:2383296-Rhodomonas_salina.2